MNRKQVEEMYLSFLRAGGYENVGITGGEISFTHNGLGYVIVVDEEDLSLFEMIYPAFWQADGAEEYVLACGVANVMNEDYKVGKMIIDANQEVSAHAELFLDSPESFTKYFDRLLNILKEMARDFEEEIEEYKEYKEENKDDGEDDSDDGEDD